MLATSGSNPYNAPICAVGAHQSIVTNQLLGCCTAPQPKQFYNPVDNQAALFMRFWSGHP